MIEKPRSQESIESPDLIELREANRLAGEKTLHEIYKRHYANLYHQPSHTVGHMREEIRGGVATAMERVVAHIENVFPESIGELSPAAKERFEVYKLAMMAGMLTHDVIIEIDNTIESDESVEGEKMTQRRRGMVPGGNEYESAEFYLDALELTAGNKHRAFFEKVLRDTVAGTVPDGTGMIFVGEAELEGLTDGAAEAVREHLVDPETGKAMILNLDSESTGDSLAHLLGSTTDLIGAAFPERFGETGDLEMFEFYYQLSRDSVAFMEKPASLSRDRAVQMLKTMEGWRKTQIGVALGQHLRLKQNFTPENTKQKFTELFAVLTEGEDVVVSPSGEEIDDFLQWTDLLSAGMQQSMIDSAKRYEDFKGYKINTEGEETLTEEEIQIMESALESVSADKNQLHRFVKDFDSKIQANSKSKVKNA